MGRVLFKDIDALIKKVRMWRPPKERRARERKLKSMQMRMKKRRMKHHQLQKRKRKQHHHQKQPKNQLLMIQLNYKTTCGDRGVFRGINTFRKAVSFPVFSSKHTSLL